MGSGKRFRTDMVKTCITETAYEGSHIRRIGARDISGPGTIRQRELQALDDRESPKLKGTGNTTQGLVGEKNQEPRERGGTPKRKAERIGGPQWKTRSKKKHLRIFVAALHEKEEEKVIGRGCGIGVGRGQY